MSKLRGELARRGGRRQPDGLKMRARGARSLRPPYKVGTATPHRMGGKPRRKRVADSPALRPDEAPGSERSRPRGCDREGVATRRDPYRRRSARHPSRRVAPARRARPHRVHPAIKPLSWKGLDRLARYGRLLSDRVAVRTHAKERSLLFLVHDSAATPLYPARAEFALAVALKLARDVRERTSHRSAFASLILHRTTLRSIGGSSTDVFGLPPVRAR